MAATKQKTETREEWLNRAAERLNEMIAEHTALKPSKKVLVSAGWPRNDRRGKVIGQCYGKTAGGGSHHVFVSPTLSTATEVLPVLLHELIHAADDCQSSHKGDFRAAWKALGFEGKPTESSPGSDLKAALREVAGELGRYPHKKLLDMGGAPKQTTRMRKLACPECGYVVRTTQKWIDTGLPSCHCGGEFEEAD